MDKWGEWGRVLRRRRRMDAGYSTVWILGTRCHERCDRVRRARRWRRHLLTRQRSHMVERNDLLRWLARAVPSTGRLRRSCPGRAELCGDEFHRVHMDHTHNVERTMARMHLRCRQSRSSRRLPPLALDPCCLLDRRWRLMVLHDVPVRRMAVSYLRSYDRVRRHSKWWHQSSDDITGRNHMDRPHDRNEAVARHRMGRDQALGS